jgi:hypothetical protein
VRCAGTRSATSDRRRAKSAGARHTEGSGTAAAEEEEEEDEDDDADEDEEDEAREAAHIAREATRNARESMEEQGTRVRLAHSAWAKETKVCRAPFTEIASPVV